MNINVETMQFVKLSINSSYTSFITRNLSIIYLLLLIITYKL